MGEYIVKVNLVPSLASLDLVLVIGMKLQILKKKLYDNMKTFYHVFFKC